MAQTLDLVVDGAVLFDEGVSMGDVSLRLIVVVIGDEILHRVFWEKFLEFAAKLGGQGLVVGKDKGGPVQPGNDVCHSKGLARAGNAKQHLLVYPVFYSHDQTVYGLGLVSGRSVIRYQFELFHTMLQKYPLIVYYYITIPAFLQDAVWPLCMLYPQILNPLKALESAILPWYNITKW